MAPFGSTKKEIFGRLRGRTEDVSKVASNVVSITAPSNSPTILSCVPVRACFLGHSNAVDEGKRRDHVQSTRQRAGRLLFVSGRAFEAHSLKQHDPADNAT